MTTNNTNEGENREDSNSSSSNNEGGKEIRKKRTRVGDLRRQPFDITPSASDRERNPYKPSSDLDRGADRPPSYDRGGYSDDRRPFDRGDSPRPTFGSTGGGSYNRGGDNRGGYDNRGGDNRGGYDNSRSYDRGNRGNDNRNDNRDGNSRSYDRGSDNRGGSTGGSYGNRDNRPSGTGGGYGNRDSRDNRPSGTGGGNYGNRDNRPSGAGGGYGNRDNRDNRQGGSTGGGYGNRDNRRPSGGYDRNPGQRGGPEQKRIVKPVKYKENIDPAAEVRLNKYLANAGVCSRREADSFITSGLVKVNGVVVNELGSKILYGAVVTFNDKPISLESKIYVLLNKPRNCVTTSDDPQNRTTVMDMVRGACSERIYPVGRLDRNTTGVLLLTNDGDLASKLMHPKYLKKKIYEVTLDKDVTMEDMQAIADGIELEDGEIHADSIAYKAEDILNTIGIEIHSGRNRIVRRIFEKLNYQVVRLDRVYFAGLTKKNVPRGKWRYLSEKEVNILRMGAFE